MTDGGSGWVPIPRTDNVFDLMMHCQGIELPSPTPSVQNNKAACSMNDYTTDDLINRKVPMNAIPKFSEAQYRNIDYRAPRRQTNNNPETVMDAEGEQLYSNTDHKKTSSECVSSEQSNTSSSTESPKPVNTTVTTFPSGRFRFSDRTIESPSLTPGRSSYSANKSPIVRQDVLEDDDDDWASTQTSAPVLKPKEDDQTKAPEIPGLDDEEEEEEESELSWMKSSLTKTRDSVGDCDVEWPCGIPGLGSPDHNVDEPMETNDGVMGEINPGSDKIPDTSSQSCDTSNAGNFVTPWSVNRVQSEYPDPQTSTPIMNTNVLPVVSSVPNATPLIGTTSLSCTSTPSSLSSEPQAVINEQGRQSMPVAQQVNEMTVIPMTPNHSSPTAMQGISTEPVTFPCQSSNHPVMSSPGMLPKEMTAPAVNVPQVQVIPPSSGRTLPTPQTPQSAGRSVLIQEPVTPTNQPISSMPLPSSAAKPLKSCLKKSPPSSPNESPEDSSGSPGRSPTTDCRQEKKKKRVVIDTTKNMTLEIPGLDPDDKLRNREARRVLGPPAPNQHQMRLRGSRPSSGDAPSTSLEETAGESLKGALARLAEDEKRLVFLKRKREFERRENEKQRKLSNGNSESTIDSLSTVTTRPTSSTQTGSPTKLASESIGPLKLKIKVTTEEPINEVIESKPNERDLRAAQHKSLEEKRQSFTRSKKVVETMEGPEESKGRSNDIPHQVPLCKFCAKPAIDDPEWDNNYCSQSCVVLHVKQVMTSFRETQHLQQQESQSLPVSSSLTYSCHLSSLENTVSIHDTNSNSEGSVSKLNTLEPMNDSSQSLELDSLTTHTLQTTEPTAAATFLDRSEEQADQSFKLSKPSPTQTLSNRKDNLILENTEDDEVDEEETDDETVTSKESNETSLSESLEAFYDEVQEQLQMKEETD